METYISPLKDNPECGPRRSELEPLGDIVGLIYCYKNETVSKKDVNKYVIHRGESLICLENGSQTLIKSRTFGQTKENPFEIDINIDTYFEVSGKSGRVLAKSFEHEYLLTGIGDNNSELIVTNNFTYWISRGKNITEAEKNFRNFLGSYSQ